MKLTVVMLGLGMLTAATGASAAVVTDWGTLGPINSASVRLDPPGPVDDVYTFMLAAKSDVPTYAIKFLGQDTNIDDAMVSLFSGTPTTSTLVGSFAFDEVQPGTTKTFKDLLAGAYFLEVTGTAIDLGGAYDVNASAQAPSPPLNVPEPANAALLLSGLGLLGFIAGRCRPH